ncbi:factor-independent urate hydroxylase [Demequina aurantiaca]|uniref:factor-independent urate hydroxylase n=1 Tax=Demequina aurantiaca TaxID=676200 RepID=UPI003D35332E
MGISLGGHQYGKAENHIVRIYRDQPRHDIKDINVSTCLRGDFEAAYLTGDQSAVLPTDTQKQTAYAYAKEVGVDSIEDYSLALARHFVDDVDPVHSSRVEVEEFGWERVLVDGSEHDHTWVRTGQEVRTAAITVEGSGEDRREWVTGGLKDLVILKSTGSEFTGFLEDKYTRLQPTTDRVMATSLVATWRYAGTEGDWNAMYATIKSILTSAFATVHSLALQQTLFQMGKAVLEAVDGVVEVNLSAPNKHHFLFDLETFGVENNGEVFHADDRPYGLIQANVVRDDAPDAGSAWEKYSGLV